MRRRRPNPWYGVVGWLLILLGLTFLVTQEDRTNGQPMFEQHEVTIGHVSWQVEALVQRSEQGVLVGAPTVLGARWLETGTPLDSKEMATLMYNMDMGDLHAALRTKMKGDSDAASEHP